MQHPVIAAASGVVYLIGRLIYFHGYGSGVPDKRLQGSPFYGVGLMGLLVTNMKLFGVWAASQLL
jgi:glutathione S-transferase